LKSGTFLARIIESGVESLAAGAALRQRDAAPKPVEEYGAAGFMDHVADTRSRLHHLAHALWIGRPELLEEHVRWHRGALAAREAPAEYLKDNLEALRDELSERLPEDDAGLAIDYVTRALAAAGEPLVEPESRMPEGKWARPAKEFLLALLEDRRNDAVNMARGQPADDFTAEVVEAAQREMGRLWQLGLVNIGEEHAGSRTVQRVLCALQADSEIAPPNGKSVVVASVGGDTHDLPVRILADTFERAGWTVHDLGCDMPAADLVAMLRDTDADVLALSASLALHVRAATDLIAAIRRDETTKDVRVLIGGRIFDQVDGLWKDVGADGTARNAREGVTEAIRLVGATG